MRHSFEHDIARAPLKLLAICMTIYAMNAIRLGLLWALCSSGCATLLGDKSDDETKGDGGGCSNGATSNNFPPGYSYSQCGSIFCGAFYEYICEDGEWRTYNVHDCLCNSPDAGPEGLVDAGMEEDGGWVLDASGMNDAQESAFDAMPDMGE